MARNIKIFGPMRGTLIPLNECSDPVFSSGAMGRGVAIKNPRGAVFSPFDGEVTVLFPTGHAIGLKSNDGIELLIHIGMDTVKMNGEGFEACVEPGEVVRRGQLLIKFNPDTIRKAGHDTTTPVVVTNQADFGDITFELEGQLITSKATAEEVPRPQYNSLPDAKRVAKLIMKYVGGSDNVLRAESCATRLRLKVNDKSKIQEMNVENIDGVKGQFFAAQQYQIICGTGFVDEVTEEFIKLKPSLAGGEVASTNRNDSQVMLNAPVERGQFMSLKDCGETSFVNGSMGRGVAVINTNGRIIAPFSGRVLQVYRNAMEIVSNDGIELFIQVGDSGFYEECVKDNQQISTNQILAYFNVNKIVMFTVKNDEDFGDITFQLGGQNYLVKPQGGGSTRANNSKENDNMSEENQGSRFTILGETGSGKTCYLLGMYYEMSMGEAGYTVVATNEEDDAKLAERYERLKDKSRGQSRFPDPTDQSQKYNFMLAYDYEGIVDFEWVDYPGGWLDVRERRKLSSRDDYNAVKESIIYSDTLFICIDGENLVGNDTRAKIRKVATKCSRNINPYLTELKKEVKGFPPIVIIVTKYDMCMNDTDADEIKEIVQHEKVFGSLFKSNDNFIAVIPVSLGDTLMDDSYSGDLDPINISLPILLGVNFALIRLLYEGKALIEERQQWKKNNQKELDWARNQKRIEDDRWGITRWLFGGYDPDQLQEGIHEFEQNIHEIEQHIKDIREIAGYFKKSAQRINRELEAVDMLFVNGAWQDAHGRSRYWSDVQSIANYF